MASKVMLGDIVISPGPRRKLKFNNPRNIAKIDIPGGAPIYQDMGEDETTLAWDGMLDGDDAYATAIKIEAMKDQGLPVALVIPDFPDLCKQVRIRSFPWELIRADRVEYSIDLIAEMPPPTVIVTIPLTGSDQQGSGATTVEAAATSSTSVTVKQGDTLWGLAQKHYGDGSRWREIASANGIMDPRTLQIGQAITIPG